MLNSVTNVVIEVNICDKTTAITVLTCTPELIIRGSYLIWSVCLLEVVNISVLDILLIAWSNAPGYGSRLVPSLPSHQHVQTLLHHLHTEKQLPCLHIATHVG